jgi:hypothetical protein
LNYWWLSEIHFLWNLEITAERTSIQRRRFVIGMMAGKHLQLHASSARGALLPADLVPQVLARLRLDAAGGWKRAVFPRLWLLPTAADAADEGRYDISRNMHERMRTEELAIRRVELSSGVAVRQSAHSKRLRGSLKLVRIGTWSTNRIRRFDRHWFASSFHYRTFLQLRLAMNPNPRL